MGNSQEFNERVQQCAEQLAAHGADALGALFDLTSVRLVRFAAALTRHQHDAEDAVQTALARLARQPGLLAGVACPWAYLLRMVRNEVLTIVRRGHRFTTSGSLGDLITYCPVDEAEREESHQAVWRALRGLPPEQAEVIVLKIWEGMTFAQIGEILGTSPNTSASRYQYAMIKLTRSLQREQPEVQHD